MFGHQFKLIRIFGFTIKVDASWFIIFALITWSLAQVTFPHFVKGLAPETYWIMAAVGALALFVSIVLHELSHSLVARRFGLQIKGITLFIFGGVAEMADEPPNAKAEFFVAIAGPIASVVIAGVCYALAMLPAPVPVRSVLFYLAAINGVLVAFNMIPAFPLDGGRVLRSILWHAKGNLRAATRITSQIGASFGLAFMLLAILQLFAGNIVGAMWWFLIGMFLRNAANASYQQLLMRRALEGEPVARFTNPHPVTVPSYVSLDEFVMDYIYRYHHKMYPASDDGSLLGCVTIGDLKQIDRATWPEHRVSELIHPVSDQNTMSAQADAMEALARMSAGGLSRLMVVDDGRLVGVLSLKDLLEFLALKIELESNDAAA